MSIPDSNKICIETCTEMCLTCKVDNMTETATVDDIKCLTCKNNYILRYD